MQPLAAWLLGTTILTSVAAAWALQPPAGGIVKHQAGLTAPTIDFDEPLEALLSALGAGTLAFASAGERRAARPARGALFADPSPLWRKAFAGLEAPYARVVPVRRAAEAPAPRMHDALYRPPSSPGMWLTQPAPPYRDSAPGQFELRVAYAAGTIEHSLFQAGQAAGLSDEIILTLVDIFGWDIDFALEVQAGDTFSVIYEEKYLHGRRIADGAVLAAEFSNRGEVHRAIGFRDRSGRIEYYTPEGRNVRRPFLRTPVKYSRVSSSFSAARHHPILKVSRAHRGVDYAAPEGTPVRATASGRVAYAGWNGGYGNLVIIDHGRGYRTLYAHLSRFRPGLRAGQRLRQGAIVGYVGQTGLATGPHLHYEFQVNGVHQDPLAFEPRVATTVPPALRPRFERVAEEWTERLDLISERNLAAR